MLEPKAPNLYLIRIYWGFRSDLEARKVWAFSAEDATFQIAKELEKSRDVERARVDYVGPFNPGCPCGSPERCFCGVRAQ